MINYTLDILDVLSAWLREKGWDVRNIYVGDDEATEGRLMTYFVNFEKYEGGLLIEYFDRKFTQSDLETNDRMEAIENAFSEGSHELTVLPGYIRAKLERQCDE